MLLRLLQDQCLDTFLLYLLTRKLHCTRNYIHMNLFVSFILRAMAVISKEIMLYLMYSNLPKDDPGWKSYSSSAVQTKWFLSSSNVYRNSSIFNPPKVFWRLNCDVFPQIVLMCKVSQVCMEYFVICNCFWLLVEAVFLHTLLFTAVLTKRRLLKRSMLLGWGKAQKSVKLLQSMAEISSGALLMVTSCLPRNTGPICNTVDSGEGLIWKHRVVLIAPIRNCSLFSSDKCGNFSFTPTYRCWSIGNKWFWWIIRGPITLSFLVSKVKAKVWPSFTEKDLWIHTSSNFCV